MCGPQHAIQLTPLMLKLSFPAPSNALSALDVVDADAWAGGVLRRATLADVLMSLLQLSTLSVMAVSDVPVHGQS